MLTFSFSIKTGFHKDKSFFDEILKRVSSKPSGKMIVAPIFLFLDLGTSDLHHRPGFDQLFWFWTQIEPAKWLNWIKYLICGCCFASVEVVKWGIIADF